MLISPCLQRRGWRFSHHPASASEETQAIRAACQTVCGVGGCVSCISSRGWLGMRSLSSVHKFISQTGQESFTALAICITICLYEMRKGLQSQHCRKLLHLPSHFLSIIQVPCPLDPSVVTENSTTTLNPHKTSVSNSAETLLAMCPSGNVFSNTGYERNKTLINQVTSVLPLKQTVSNLMYVDYVSKESIVNSVFVQSARLAQILGSEMDLHMK